MQNLDLFPALLPAAAPAGPRAKPRVLMHVSDAPRRLRRPGAQPADLPARRAFRSGARDRRSGCLPRRAHRAIAHRGLTQWNES